MVQRACAHVPREDDHHPRNFAFEENKCRITRTTVNGKCGERTVRRIRIQRGEIHPDVVTYSSLIKSHNTEIDWTKSLADLAETRRNETERRSSLAHAELRSRSAWRPCSQCG